MPMPKSILAYKDECWEYFERAAAGERMEFRWPSQLVGDRDQGLIAARMFIFRMNGFRVAARRARTPAGAKEVPLLPPSKRDLLPQMYVDMEEVVVRSPLRDGQYWLVVMESRMVEAVSNAPIITSSRPTRPVDDAAAASFARIQAMLAPKPAAPEEEDQSPEARLRRYGFAP